MIVVRAADSSSLLKISPLGSSQWLEGFCPTELFWISSSAESREPPRQAGWGVFQQAPSSCQQLLHDTPGDIGQAKVAALIAERQALVLQSEQMQQRRVKIVDVDGVFEHSCPQVVR